MPSPRIADRLLISLFALAAVMNAITFKAAYSFYPEATFEHRWNLVCAKQPYPARTKAALGKNLRADLFNKKAFSAVFTLSQNPFISGERVG